MSSQMLWRSPESTQGHAVAEIAIEPLSVGSNQRAVVQAEAARERLEKAVLRDSMARGIHPAPHTTGRAVAVYRGVLESLTAIVEATVHVQRDEGIEFTFRTARASAVVTVEPTAEPEFEVSIYQDGIAAVDETFDRAAKAVACLAARLR